MSTTPAHNAAEVNRLAVARQVYVLVESVFEPFRRQFPRNGSTIVDRSASSFWTTSPLVLSRLSDDVIYRVYPHRSGSVVHWPGAS